MGFMAAIVIAALVFFTAPVSPAETAASHETLAEILARWRAYVAPLRNVPRDVRVPESKKFFLSVPWEEIDYLCLEGSPGVNPDSAGTLEHLMTYRLEVGPPPLETMAAMIEKPGYITPCKAPLMAWANRNRDSLSAGDRRRFADAELRATQIPTLPAAFREQLYIGAASLVADDSLMGVMMAGARAADEARARLSVRMLASSVDRRSPDSLALLARAYHAAGSPVLDEALIHCRGRCADLAMDVFIDTFHRARSREQELLALEATARVPRREAMQAILDFYGDGAIADSTFAAPDSARARYYSLWIATRAAEPRLVEWLEKGSKDEARLAIELLDRALRFGPADRDSVVVAALLSWAERAPKGDSSRALAVRERAAKPHPILDYGHRQGR